MSDADTIQTTEYVLPLDQDAARPEPAAPARQAALPEPLLLRNVLWFCRLRWVVIATLVVLAGLGQWPALIGRIGWRPHPHWPLLAAGVLALGNLAFLGHARLLARSAVPVGATVNLWGQIALDLGVLTVVVHFAGSLETYAAFAYLFHIVLACIFFSRGWSLIIVIMACVLYGACVMAEAAGLVGLSSIYVSARIREAVLATPGAAPFNVASAVGIWLVVWYLTSHLSVLVRQRDAELATTNQRLIEAQGEKTRHMLRTTHELKAPFAAIHANTHLLLKGHCGPLRDDARKVVERIAVRAGRLAHEIQEMLQLANLRSVDEETLAWANHDLAEAIRQCIARMEAHAGERGVIVEADLEPAWTWGVDDHLRMLFDNVLSNAVTYSHEGGRVAVTCRPLATGGAAVTVEDRGIGIAPAKLPHIFEEYYRTDEAARHNTHSSGLGLAIVRHVAESHRIRICVRSGPGTGTAFTLTFPGTRAPGGAAPQRKEEARWLIS